MMKVVQEIVPVRSYQELTYDNLSGWHKITQPIAERVLTQNNIRRQYGKDNFNKHGCMVIDLSDKNKPDYHDIFATIEQFDRHLRSDKDKVQAYMWPIFNTIPLEGREEIQAELDAVFTTPPTKQGQPRGIPHPKSHLDFGRNQFLLFSALEGDDENDPFYVEARRLAKLIGDAIEALICAALEDDSGKGTIVVTLLETLAPVKIAKTWLSVSNQLLHRDLSVPLEGVRPRGTAVGLLALQDNTDIRVQVGSHLKGDTCPRAECTIFRLKKGQLFVGHPHLIHSGASASEWNLRLHFYLGLQLGNEIHMTDIVAVVDAKDNQATTEAVRATKENKRERKLAVKRKRSEFCEQLNA